MSWYSRFRNAFRGDRLSRHLDEEIETHIAQRAAALEAQGMAPDKAYAEAARMFGNRTQVHENDREVRLLSWLDTAAQDVRYAMRVLRKSPAFVVTAIASLSIAIGANTAIYSIVDAALLRPLPVRDPGTLVQLSTPDIRQEGEEPGHRREAFSYPVFRAMSTAGADKAELVLSGYVGRSEFRSEPGAPLEKAQRQFVSGNYFNILGISPVLGRLLQPDDDRGAATSGAAVISYDFWHNRFGGSPSVLGKRIFFDKKSLIVVGVARKEFFGVEPGKFVDLWIPASLYDKDALTNAGWSWFRILARMNPGATPAQLEDRIHPEFHAHIMRQISDMNMLPPAIKRQFEALRVDVRPVPTGVSSFRRTFAKPLWIVLGVVFVLLLIACANVASLLLARSNARASEMAVRVSLGAARARLVRQLITECILLAVISGAIGWLIARFAAPGLVGMLSRENDPLMFALSLNARMLLSCTIISALTVILFGLQPAWQSSAVQPVSVLRASTNQSARLRLGRAFVSVQVAFAFSLVLVGAAFVITLRNLTTLDPGFAPENLVIANVRLPEGGKAPQQKEMAAQFLQSLQQAPGVENAATAPWAIFADSVWSAQIIVPGRARLNREDVFYRVSPTYFATLKTPVLEGRAFERNDDPEVEPIPAIINLACARIYFGTDHVVGREFVSPSNKDKVKRYRVTGVVADSHYQDLRVKPEPTVYLPIDGSGQLAVYVRSRMDMGSVNKLVESRLPSLLPGSRVTSVTTLDTLIGNTIVKEKLLAGIAGAFALIGLMLASIGIFGLLSYSVSRRTKEIGIRTALGARKRTVMALVIRDLVSMIGVGLLAGVAGAVGALVALRSQLFGISPADPLVIAGCALLFLVVAALAAGLPARRAASVDPIVALRYE